MATFSRVSKLSSINFRSLRIEEDYLEYSLLSPRKTQTQSALATFTVKRFRADTLVCPVKCISLYLKATAALRKPDSDLLFLAIKKPHYPVGTSTIARWIKKILRLSGIDIRTYSAHSTRGASVSRVFAKGTSCDQILAKAGWKRKTTFQRFYNRSLDNEILTDCTYRTIR